MECQECQTGQIRNEKYAQLAVVLSVHSISVSTPRIIGRALPVAQNGKNNA